MAVASIAGLVVAVAVVSSVVIEGAAKDMVAVRAGAAPMVPPLIRRVPLAEAVIRSGGRPGAAVVVVMNGRVVVVRGATAPMTLVLRRQEARTDPVDIACPKMTLVGNATSVWKFPFGTNLRLM